MSTRTLTIILLILVCTSFSAPRAASAQFKVRENNLYAPNLYADKLDFVATLVDLPGAKKRQSSWELSYQLFFIPEDKYYAALRRLPKGGSSPTPEQFPGRVLLAEGQKKKTRLSTPEERTIALDAVAFKEKVVDAQRTKSAVLMTAYSVKIFDAELSTTVYHSGIFLTEPYEENEQKQAVPRRAIYLNFSVSPDGTLNYSQLRRKQQ
jgi:hypothetical protein